MYTILPAFPMIHVQQYTPSTIDCTLFSLSRAGGVGHLITLLTRNLTFSHTCFSALGKVGRHWWSRVREARDPRRDRATPQAPRGVRKGR